MPPFRSGSRAIFSLISRRSEIKNTVRCGKNDGKIRRFDKVRWFSSMSGIETNFTYGLIDPRRDRSQTSFGGTNVQRRRFLGCGDGEGGGALSKIYEERILMGYSPEQLFNVVAAVDLYHGFVPWCQRSEILKHYSDGSFDAELEIGFKFLVESYVSHVELDKPKSVKTTAKDTGLFDHLINVWQFKPGPVPGTCDLYFLVDFKFNSPLYRQVASVFFTEVVSRLVGSFSERCRLVYGPGVPVSGKSIQQSA